MRCLLLLILSLEFVVALSQHDCLHWTLVEEDTILLNRSASFSQCLQIPDEYQKEVVILVPWTWKHLQIAFQRENTTDNVLSFFVNNRHIISITGHNSSISLKHGISSLEFNTEHSSLPSHIYLVDNYIQFSTEAQPLVLTAETKSLEEISFITNPNREHFITTHDISNFPSPIKITYNSGHVKDVIRIITAGGEIRAKTKFLTANPSACGDIFCVGDVAIDGIIDCSVTMSNYFNLTVNDGAVSLGSTTGVEILAHNSFVQINQHFLPGMSNVGIRIHNATTYTLSTTFRGRSEAHEGVLLEYFSTNSSVQIFGDGDVGVDVIGSIIAPSVLIEGLGTTSVNDNKGVSIGIGSNCIVDTSFDIIGASTPGISNRGVVIAGNITVPRLSITGYAANGVAGRAVSMAPSYVPYSQLIIHGYGADGSSNVAVYLENIEPLLPGGEISLFAYSSQSTVISPIILLNGDISNYNELSIFINSTGIASGLRALDVNINVSLIRMDIHVRGGASTLSVTGSSFNTGDIEINGTSSLASGSLIPFQNAIIVASNSISISATVSQPVSGTCILLSNTTLSSDSILLSAITTPTTALNNGIRLMTSSALLATNIDLFVESISNGTRSAIGLQMDSTCRFNATDTLSIDTNSGNSASLNGIIHCGDFIANCPGSQTGFTTSFTSVVHATSSITIDGEGTSDGVSLGGVVYSPNVTLTGTSFTSGSGVLLQANISGQSFSAFGNSTSFGIRVSSSIINFVDSIYFNGEGYTAVSLDGNITTDLLYVNGYSGGINSRGIQCGSTTNIVSSDIIMHSVGECQIVGQIITNTWNITSSTSTVFPALTFSFDATVDNLFIDVSSTNPSGSLFDVMSAHNTNINGSALFQIVAVSLDSSEIFLSDTRLTNFTTIQIVGTDTRLSITDCEFIAEDIIIDLSNDIVVNVFSDYFYIIGGNFVADSILFALDSTSSGSLTIEGLCRIVARDQFHVISVTGYAAITFESVIVTGGNLSIFGNATRVDSVHGVSLIGGTISMNGSISIEGYSAFNGVSISTALNSSCNTGELFLIHGEGSTGISSSAHRMTCTGNAALQLFGRGTIQDIRFNGIIIVSKEKGLLEFDGFVRADSINVHYEPTYADVLFRNAVNIQNLNIETNGTVTIENAGSGDSLANIIELSAAEVRLHTSLIISSSLVLNSELYIYGNLMIRGSSYDVLQSIDDGFSAGTSTLHYIGTAVFFEGDIGAIRPLSQFIGEGSFWFLSSSQQASAMDSLEFRRLSSSYENVYLDPLVFTFHSSNIRFTSEISGNTVIFDGNSYFPVLLHSHRVSTSIMQNGVATVNATFNGDMVVNPGTELTGNGRVQQSLELRGCTFRPSFCFVANETSFTVSESVFVVALNGTTSCSEYTQAQTTALYITVPPQLMVTRNGFEPPEGSAYYPFRYAFRDGSFRGLSNGDNIDVDGVSMLFSYDIPLGGVSAIELRRTNPFPSTTSATLSASRTPTPSVSSQPSFSSTITVTPTATLSINASPSITSSTSITASASTTRMNSVVMSMSFFPSSSVSISLSHSPVISLTPSQSTLFTLISQTPTRSPGLLPEHPSAIPTLFPSPSRSSSVKPTSAPSITPAAQGCGPCTTDTIQTEISSNSENIIPFTDATGGHAGSILIPPNSGGVLVNVVVTTNIPQDNRDSLGSTSVDITILDTFGNEITHFGNRPIEICLTQNNQVDDGDVCLSFFNTNTKRWECQDECLKHSESEYCGNTDHLTSFALLLSGAGNRNDDPCGTKDENYVLAWISFALIVASCSLMFCAVMLIEFRYRMKAKKQSDFLRQHAKAMHTTL